MNESLKAKRAVEGEMALGACNAGALIRALAEWMNEDQSLRFDDLINDPGAFLVMNQLAQLFDTNNHEKFREAYQFAIDVRTAKEDREIRR